MLLLLLLLCFRLSSVSTKLKLYACWVLCTTVAEQDRILSRSVQAQLIILQLFPFDYVCVLQLHDRALKQLLANVIATAAFRVQVSALCAPSTAELCVFLKTELNRLLTSAFMSDQALGFKLCMEVETGSAARYACCLFERRPWRKHACSWGMC